MTFTITQIGLLFLLSALLLTVGFVLVEPKPGLLSKSWGTVAGFICVLGLACIAAGAL